MVCALIPEKSYGAQGHGRLELDLDGEELILGPAYIYTPAKREQHRIKMDFKRCLKVESI
jgi:hypothetical protein